MVLNEVALLVSENGRARAYVDLLSKAGIRVSNAIILESPQIVQAPVQPVFTQLFDNVTPVKTALNKARIKTKIVVSDSINDDAVVDAVRSLQQSIIIFAGPAGSLLRKPFFEINKVFLHVHPGKLPDYRGSTPMYYSLLDDNTISATAFIMAEAIDAGEVLFEKTFQPPEDRLSIDLIYDPYIRAKVLLDVMIYYCQEGVLPTPKAIKDDGATYYIIHPVLKHIALLS